MNTRFLTLFTLRATHSYYADGICPDFDFVLAEHSRRAMNGARMLARVHAGQLHLLFEAAENSLPMQNIAGLELLIGLRLRNPYFEHFTDVLSEPLPLYANTTTTLNDPQASDLISHRFAPKAATTQRPLTLNVHRTRDNALMWSDEIQDGVTMPTLDTRSWEAGCYLVTQQSAAGTRSRPLIVAPDLADAGIWGAVSIRVTPDLWNAPTPPDFHIGFNAREEALNYYLVAPPGWHDFDKLLVIDTAQTLLFEKFVPDEFPPEGLSPALLGAPDAQVVLFRSTLPVPRSAAASLHIQLKHNGNTLVKNLPLPGADMPSSRLVIHLSKP